MVKSTWPGVSMMLKRCSGNCRPMPFQNVVVAADVMVMPRSCSAPSSPWWQRRRALHRSCGSHRCKQDTLGGGRLTGINVCADRYYGSAQWGFRATAKTFSAIKIGLPAEVREGFVGFCHTVHFVTLFHCAAATFCCIQKLTSQTQVHGLSRACERLHAASAWPEPDDGTGGLQLNLVVGAANRRGFTSTIGFTLPMAVENTYAFCRSFSRSGPARRRRCVRQQTSAVDHHDVHELGHLTLPNFGSGNTSRFGTSLTRLGIITSGYFNQLSEMRSAAHPGTTTYSTAQLDA